MLRHRRCSLGSIFAICLMAAMSLPASALTVSSSGAVDVNALWEAGKSSIWYIEEQRKGDDFICEGIRCENDSLIQQGLKIYDWGFARQAADGSFAGTGDTFHSTSLFVEAAARSTLLLKQYKPVTYTRDYSSVVSSYTSKLKSACNWLTKLDIAAKGQEFNEPYTHRRYLLAAALGQAAKLSGSSTHAAAAASYANSGLALQWSNGVNPEMGGYDVEYQCAGIRYAASYYNVCSDATLRSRLYEMISKGLAWEAARINVDGILDSTGSTRIGVEKNRDGSVKRPTMSDIAAAFVSGYKITGAQLFSVVAARIKEEYFAGCTQAINANGAVGNNAKFDSRLSTKYLLGLQRYGADYIEAGIAREDDRLIRAGINILNWGFALQAVDGSFPFTETPFYNVAQFVEAAARATLMLGRYSPVTYSIDRTYYTSLISRYIPSIHLASKWLTRSDVATSAKKSDLPFTNRRWLMAAALSQAAELTGDSTVRAAALPYAKDGIALQWSNGVNPEKGTYDVNNQAVGILYAIRYHPYCTDATVKSSVVKMMDLGLTWEATRVNLVGDVNTGTSQGASYHYILPAFRQGFLITGKQLFQVVAERIDENH